jgi:hypothetical protein
MRGTNNGKRESLRQQRHGILFIIGSVMIIVSLFTKWYVVRIWDGDGFELVSWSFQVAWNWMPSQNFTLPESLSLNLMDFSFPLIIIWGILLVSGIVGALSLNLGSSTIKTRSFLMVASSVMTITMALLFPVTCLYPSTLYFPFITVHDPELDMTISYAIQIGYWLLYAGFGLTFPSALTTWNEGLTLERVMFEPADSKARKEDAECTLDLESLILEEEEIKLNSTKPQVALPTTSQREPRRRSS